VAGNVGTRGLPAFSIVSQPTTVPRTALLKVLMNIIFMHEEQARIAGATGRISMLNAGIELFCDTIYSVHRLSVKLAWQLIKQSPLM
jgi:hypothetical protein